MGERGQALCGGVMSCGGIQYVDRVWGGCGERCVEWCVVEGVYDVLCLWGGNMTGCAGWVWGVVVLVGVCASVECVCVVGYVHVMAGYRVVMGCGGCMNMEWDECERRRGGECGYWVGLCGVGV